MALQGKLRVPNRFITTHDEKGQAVIDTSVPAETSFYELSPGDAAFAQCYVTGEFPVQLQDSADISLYRDFLKQPPGLTVSTGTVLRYVDLPPGRASPMHRTVSLDYGVVMEGVVELILDSGVTKVMRPGDICIQRATMHAWRNTSETEWARMLYVLQPAATLSIGGKEMKEDYGGMHGVRTSS